MGHLRDARSSAAVTRGLASPPSPRSIATPRVRRDATLALSMAILPISDPDGCTTVAADSAANDGERRRLGYLHAGGCLAAQSQFFNPLTYRVDASVQHPVQRLCGWGTRKPAASLLHLHQRRASLVVKGRWPFDVRRALVAVASGPTPIHQRGGHSGRGRAAVHSPMGVPPVVRVMSQSDYLSGIAAPDEATLRSDLYRKLRLPGPGHTTPDELNFAAAPADIEKAAAKF